MAAQITDAKKEAIGRRAAAVMSAWEHPVKFELHITLVVGLIGQLQLAFRHPQNVGPTRRQLEIFVRDMIEQLDPDHGDLHALLTMGFHEQYDE
jgi:hypothetical protein